MEVIFAAAARMRWRLRIGGRRVPRDAVQTYSVEHGAKIDELHAPIIASGIGLKKSWSRQCNSDCLLQLRPNLPAIDNNLTHPCEMLLIRLAHLAAPYLPTASSKSRKVFPANTRYIHSDNRPTANSGWANSHQRTCGAIGRPMASPGSSNQLHQFLDSWPPPATPLLSSCCSRHLLLGIPARLDGMALKPSLRFTNVFRYLIFLSAPGESRFSICLISLPLTGSSRIQEAPAGMDSWSCCIRLKTLRSMHSNPCRERTCDLLGHR